MAELKSRKWGGLQLSSQRKHRRETCALQKIAKTSYRANVSNLKSPSESSQTTTSRETLNQKLLIEGHQGRNANSFEGFLNATLLHQISGRTVPCDNSLPKSLKRRISNASFEAQTSDGKTPKPRLCIAVCSSKRSRNEGAQTSNTNQC